MKKRLDKQKINEKKEDEIYCPECGKVINKDFDICPYCRKEIKQKDEDKEIKKDKVEEEQSIEADKGVFSVEITLPDSLFE